ncbi:MAG: YceI family protein [Polaribacter sp.]|nr:YceI family protein [Polaribacter sp.]
MKKLFLLLIASILLNSFSYSQEKLEINIQKSTIKWIGELTFNFGGHDGFINFREGYFIKNNEIITGGEFIIDMNSITNADIKDQRSKNDLINHLKEPDFFDVKKHPTATLKIKSVAYFKNNIGRIYADLTIKGITNSIEFNTTFNYAEKEMNARFKIDRKSWNVNYQSKFKNSFISDAIGFEVTIKL